MGKQMSMIPLFGEPEVSPTPESPKQPRKTTPLDSGKPRTEMPKRKPVTEKPESPKPRPRTRAGASSANLTSGALRAFGILYRDGDYERVVLKVGLPADVLALARLVPAPPRTPGAPGRPSVAQGLATVVADALNSLPECDILRVAQTNLGEPTAGMVNVDVDTTSLAALSACAKGLHVTVPQLVGRVLVHTLRNDPPDQRPARRLTPGLVEVSQDFQRRRGTGVHTTHVVLPVAYLTAAKEAARGGGVSRMAMLGRLIKAGLETADADPWPVLRSLTDPQTVVPPASSKSRVTIPVGVWASVQALAALVSRPADDVAAALLGLGLSTRSRATGRA